jgi:L-lactate dehydrogenase complex protein LldG
VASKALSARDEVLAHVSSALCDVPVDESPHDVEVPRRYARLEPGDAVERFVERVSAYRTDVRRVARDEIAAVVGDCCREYDVRFIGVPTDLPSAWIPDDVEPVRAEGLDARALDLLDGAMTGCTLAIAETGTIVLDAGARQGARALTLVPDLHVCIVEESQIVGGVPEAMTRIAQSIRRLLRPITFVSGPSATSDIELSRVEGVHGPRTLIVIVVKEA